MNVYTYVYVYLCAHAYVFLVHSNNIWKKKMDLQELSPTLMEVSVLDDNQSKAKKWQVPDILQW